MWKLCRLIFGLIADLFRSRAALEAEVLVLRQQIIVLRRMRPTHLPFATTDRLVLGWVVGCFRPVLSENYIRPGFASGGRIIA
jgi:hypothetical protein